MRHPGGGNVRLYGPYKHRDRWRVVRRERGKEDVVCSYETEARARAVIAEFKAITEGRTVTEALKAFKEHQTSERMAPNTILATTGALNRILGPKRDEMMVADITPRKAQALYNAMRAKGKAVASEHGSLERAKAWGAWMATVGWVKSSPFADVKYIGEPRKGRDQLRLDEARILVESCLSRATRGSIAVLCYLVLGVRQGELRALTGRDVDDGGTLLWIARGKTKSAKRHLEVPAFLAAHLARLAAEVGQLGRVFPGSKEWVRRHTDAACTVAGVPRVTPHGLRGTHSTLAVRGGSSSALVVAALEEASRSMGHASTGITASTYVAPGAVDAATARTLFKVLSGGRNG